MGVVSAKLLQLSDTASSSFKIWYTDVDMDSVLVCQFCHNWLTNEQNISRVCILFNVTTARIEKVGVVSEKFL